MVAATTMTATGGGIQRDRGVYFSIIMPTSISTVIDVDIASRVCTGVRMYMRTRILHMHDNARDRAISIEHDRDQYVQAHAYARACASQLKS